MTTPPPNLQPGMALFLDLDGTLLELAPTPDSVSVPQGLLPLLQSLSGALDGALAVISGRTLASVDALLSPWRPAAAGLHGAELRRTGLPHIERGPAPDLKTLVQILEERFRDDAGILIEDKGAAVALHYRSAPERAADCATAIEQVTQGRSDVRLLYGHCVIEVLPAAASKGSAIQRLMTDPPFAGRIPIFAGDDSTDEDAFPIVAGLGGLGVKVGPQTTRAVHRLPAPTAVRRWLRSSLESLESGHGHCSEP